MRSASQALLIAIVVTLGMTATVAYGAVSDEQVQQLIDRIEEQDRRIAELEKGVKTSTEQSQVAVATAESSRKQVDSGVARAEKASAAVSWAERIKLQGDLRFRQENIELEGSSSRSRQRIRARAALIAQVQDNLEVGMGLSTGSEDPVSANQTLGNGFSKKGVALDLAYFDWTMRPGTHLVGGKFKNPFYRPGDNGLIWDDDLRPEGISVQWDSGTFFASGSGFTAQENASRSDTFIFGAQLGGRLQFNEDIGLTVGVGYFDLSDVEGRPLLFAPDDSFGNSTATNTNGDLIYATGYQEVEAFAELAMKVNNLPLRMFVDYVNNTEADELDTGWAIGMTLGKVKAKGSWAFGYVYEDLQADAVLGLLTDSDFGGGGTDVRGHVLSGAYALTDRTSLKATYFINEIGEDLGTSRDYDRLQMDVSFKY